MAADSPSSRPKRSSSSTPDAPNKKRPPVGDEDVSTDSEDAITKEEIEGTEPTAASSSEAPRARNACMRICLLP